MDVWNCTTQRGNAHRTENRKVVYLWHPWAGCTVQIHHVIDKVAGAVARCSHGESATGRLLELPLWMFDQSTCTPMRVETHPHVDIAALRALRALLDATTIGDVEVGRTPSNAPVRGAAKVSRKPNRGEAHATTTAVSTRPPRRNTAVQSIHYGEEQQQYTPTPEWLTLPVPTRQALTVLMTRLIRDHAASDHHQPRKVDHDV